MLHHPAFVREPELTTPEVFFEEVCPKVMEIRHEACRAFGGSVAFDLGPEASWTVDLARGIVERCAPEIVDLRVEIGHTDFARVLNGKTHFVDVLRAGALQLTGDVRMLERLSILFGE